MIGDKPGQSPMFLAFVKTGTRVCLNGRYFPSPNRNVLRKAARLSPLADAFNGVKNADGTMENAPYTGLFQNEVLRKPSGFNELVAQATRECRMLLHEAVSPSRTRKMVQVSLFPIDRRLF